MCYQSLRLPTDSPHSIRHVHFFWKKIRLDGLLTLPPYLRVLLYAGPTKIGISVPQQSINTDTANDLDACQCYTIQYPPMLILTVA